MHEIRLAFGSFGFPNLGTNCGSAAKQLFQQDVLFFLFTQKEVEFYNAKGKGVACLPGDSFVHGSEF